MRYFVIIGAKMSSISLRVNDDGLVIVENDGMPTNVLRAIYGVDVPLRFYRNLSAPLVAITEDFFNSVAVDVALGAQISGSSVKYDNRTGRNFKNPSIIGYESGVDDNGITSSAVFSLVTGFKRALLDISFDDSVRPINKMYLGEVKLITGVLSSIAGADLVAKCLSCEHHPSHLFLRVLVELSRIARVGGIPDFVQMKNLSADKQFFDLSLVYDSRFLDVPSYNSVPSMPGALVDKRELTASFPITGNDRFAKISCVDDAVSGHSFRSLEIHKDDFESPVVSYCANVMGINHSDIRRKIALLA